MSLEEALDRLASADPTPGAGAAAAWCCALAAALVEMVARVAQARGEGSAAMERRLERAGELRARAVSLADEDAAAYRAAINAPPERRGERTAPRRGSTRARRGVRRGEPVERLLQTHEGRA